MLALPSVERAAYRLGEADLEGHQAAFKEAGKPASLYDLSEPVQAVLNLLPGLLGHFRLMALGPCKNRGGRTGRVAAKWEAQWGPWRDAQVVPGETRAGRF